jgi:hypothetical protein
MKAKSEKVGTCYPCFCVDNNLSSLAYLEPTRILVTG